MHKTNVRFEMCGSHEGTGTTLFEKHVLNEPIGAHISTSCWTATGKGRTRLGKCKTTMRRVKCSNCSRHTTQASSSNRASEMRSSVEWQSAAVAMCRPQEKVSNAAVNSMYRRDNPLNLEPHCSSELDDYWEVGNLLEDWKSRITTCGMKVSVSSWLSTQGLSSCKGNVSCT